MEIDLDLAIVVGGYNSSNTTHLVELLEQKATTYFIKDVSEIKENFVIEHFDIHKHEMCVTNDWFNLASKLKIGITSGASCPDVVVENVIERILELVSAERNVDEVLAEI